MAPHKPSRAHSIANVRRMFKAFETGDLHDAAEYVHPEYFNRESDDRTNARGPDELAHSVAWLRGAFSELKFEEQDVVVSGEKVAMRVVMSGCHTGDFIGHAATGRRFAAEQVHLFTLWNGKILSHHAVRDDLAMHRQLGLLSPKA
ncbi:MAG TPA: ester cyclase [Stellaceae bacterium]|jgi:nogalonic acid methyl ester cyclase/aklanonic acid methyl ester cyclase|nr:ester cyclase [Stellaceae bacterium]